jgi:steroid delta-isomerase-like uncharacterized protein
MSASSSKRVVQRWYQEMWNEWNFGLVDELVAPELVFRGSLGTPVQGREGLRRYIREIRAAFPDFYNQIDVLLAEGNQVAARLTYTGTHRGPIWGIAATGRRIEYAGAGFFRVRDGRVTDGWVLGDTAALRAQLTGPG